MAEFIVLGAGMVGVATALSLQERGHSVVLLDRRAPGREASYGNAGIIQVEVMEPYAFPRAPRDILKVAFGLGNAINYHLTALPAAALPLLSYYVNSAPARYARISAVYRKLIGRCGADHDRLILESGSESLIRRTGYIQMHRTAKGLDDNAAQAERYARELGVGAKVLNNRDLRREEPCLRTDFVGAVHWSETRNCSDPGALVDAYAKLFLKRGGTLLNAEVAALVRSKTGWRVMLQDRPPVSTSNIVVALGAWSPNLLKPLGVSVPMVRKRGYHRHYRAPIMPNRPLFDVAVSALYCPMRSGLRITTGAEIARMSAPKTPKQLCYAEIKAREVLALGEPVEPEPWAGWRPCLPDMLPVVGAVPGYPGLWCNFGHGHQGFTLGPTSASLLTELIDGVPRGEVETALSPSRFT